MTEHEVIQFLDTYGYLGKVAPDIGRADYSKLNLGHSAVRDAVRLYQNFDTVNVDLEAVRHHGRHVIPDGDVGPATEAAMAKPRCGFPDFNPPGEMMLVGEATGSGNWKGCHGVGNFHCAVCKVDMSGISPEWGQIWTDVLRMAQLIAAEVGFLWLFVDDRGVDMLTGEDRSGEFVDTECTFVRQAPGWIGLAIVGQNMTCESRRIWLKLLTTYARSLPLPQRLWQCAALIVHELWHNLGWGHDGNSIIQSPAIHTHTRRPTWIGDSLEASIRRAFGGEPVPIPGDVPTDDPPPPPPGDPLAKRVLELERQQFKDNMTNAYQTALIDWYGTRISKLEQKR